MVVVTRKFLQCRRRSAEREELLRRKEQELLEQEKKLETFVEEKGELLKQKNQLERELTKYKQRAEESMFPDASSVERLNGMGRANPAYSSPSQVPGVSGITSTPTKASNATFVKPPEDTQTQARCTADGTLPKSQALREEAPKFILREKSVPGSSSVAKVNCHSNGLSTYKPIDTSWDQTGPRHGISEVTLGVERNCDRLDKHLPDTAESSAAKCPWKPAADKRDCSHTSTQAYESGLLDGRLHARYSTMFDLGSRDSTRKFGGKQSDYSIFRQQLVRDYTLLYQSDPYTLLQKIANSVADGVYEHIKSAWVMRDPQHALDRIWEILEDLYGDPRRLLDNAIREVKWEKGSLATRVSSLQAYRTKLRNLESIAISIDMLSELSRPKLVFRIVDCFNSLLYAQFAQQHKDFKLWSFEKVLAFLDEQISNLQFKERHAFDISAIIGDEKPADRELETVRKPRCSARVNNLQQAESAPAAENSPYRARALNGKADGHTTRPHSMSSNTCIMHPHAPHRTIDCRQFLRKGVTERRQFVRENGLCFYCLEKHLARQCPAKQQCSKCKGKHSELLHTEAVSNQRRTSYTSFSSDRDDDNKATPEPEKKIDNKARSVNSFLATTDMETIALLRFLY